MTVTSSFRVSRIIYFAGITSAESIIIPLGTLAHVALPHMHGMALKARTSLSDANRALVTPLLAELSHNPYAFLHKEFELAWVGDTGTALDILAVRHTTSLSVSRPTDYAKGMRLLKLEIPAREDAVVADLTNAVISEFDKMMEQFGGTSSDPSMTIESKLRAA